MYASALCTALGQVRCGCPVLTSAEMLQSQHGGWHCGYPCYTPSVCRTLLSFQLSLLDPVLSQCHSYHGQSLQQVQPRWMKMEQISACLQGIVDTGRQRGLWVVVLTPQLKARRLEELPLLSGLVSVVGSRQWCRGGHLAQPLRCYSRHPYLIVSACV